MAARWTFYAFDWEGFRMLAPAIQRASQARDAAGLDLSPECETAASELPPEATAAELAALLVSDLCVVGEPVAMEAGLPSMLRRMRRQREGEDAADLLTLAIVGRPNVEDWLKVDPGPWGLLTPTQTRELAESLMRLASGWKPTPARGVVRVLSGFSAGERAESRFGDLVALAQRAMEAGQGIVVFVER